MPKPAIFIGADHAGFALKEKVKAHLESSGYDIYDVSPVFKANDDYPAIGSDVAHWVAKTKNARGILVCGSGVGISIAANRIDGARAFDAYDARTTKLARQHNDANIISLSGWHLDIAAAKKMVDLFLKTRFSSAARHHRRVKQLG
ncbi:MAG: RpiB/LacA/LacB family sugar-phosphate isomerase [Patescibacteria group bacterium]